MKRYNINLQEEQVEKLKVMARATGVSLADLVRLAINQYIQRFTKKLEI